MEDLKSWEYFCDASYYDKWAVRDKADRSFHSAIHVGTKEEAEFLANSLNELLTLQDRYNAQEKSIQDMRNYILEAESKVHEYEYSNTRIITKIKYMTQQALTQLKAKGAR